MVLRVATGHHTFISKRAGTGAKGARSPKMGSWPTSVNMSLLGEFIVRIAVGVNGLVQLLKGHEGMHKLVVGVKQAAEPLLALHEMYLEAQH